MLANFPRGDFPRKLRNISKFSKTKGESSSCVCVSHKRDILGNLTWKSCGIVKKCTRKCAPRAVLLSRSLSVFYFNDFLRFMNDSNIYDSKSIEENAQNIRFVLGSLSNDDGDGPTAARTEKKVIGLDWQNNNFARVSHFFVHFLPSLHDYGVKLPNFTFYGGREHMTTNFFFFL